MDLKGRRPESEALANAALPPEGRLSKSQQILSDIYSPLIVIQNPTFLSQLATIPDQAIRISEGTQMERKKQKKKKHVVGQMYAPVSAVAKGSPVLLTP